MNIWAFKGYKSSIVPFEQRNPLHTHTHLLLQKHWNFFQHFFTTIPTISIIGRCYCKNDGTAGYRYVILFSILRKKNYSHLFLNIPKIFIMLIFFIHKLTYFSCVVNVFFTKGQYSILWSTPHRRIPSLFQADFKAEIFIKKEHLKDGKSYR